MPLNELQRRQKEAAKKRRQRERQKLRAKEESRAAENAMAAPEAVPVVVVPDTSMLDLELMNATRLAQLLGRSEKMVRVDASRRPNTLPPRFTVPGMRKLLWRTKDVRAWMDELSAAEVERRAAMSEANALGVVVLPAPGDIQAPYSRKSAVRATARMLDRAKDR